MKKIVMLVLTAMFMVGCVQEPIWPTAYQTLGAKIRVDNKTMNDKIVL